MLRMRGHVSTDFFSLWRAILASKHGRFRDDTSKSIRICY